MRKPKMTLEEMTAKAKPRRKAPRSEESRIQKECVRWFRYRHPKLRHRLLAVPNGGRRDAVTGARLQAEGVVPGVADLLLLVPNRFYGALCIEMKTPKGRQSKEQKDWQRAIEPDYKYVICRSVDDFIREVERYLEDE